MWSFFAPRPQVDHERLVAALAAADAGTSGEIRVLISRRRTTAPLQAAQDHFDRLGLARSPHRNNILIFVAPGSRNFAIIGDQAVHEVCGDAFWTQVTAAMAVRFRQGDFTAGLVHGVEEAGRILASAFPRGPGDGPVPPAQATEVD